MNQDLIDIKSRSRVSDSMQNDSYRASLYDIKPLRRESVIRLQPMVSTLMKDLLNKHKMKRASVITKVEPIKKREYHIPKTTFSALAKQTKRPILGV